MRILLVGNPNVGKSVIFNRLTGANVICSNYPGTTVELIKGHMRVAGERVELRDVPGTYSLEASSPAEEVAVRMLEDGDVIINVVDATNLERSLNLTLQLLKRRIPMIVALNLWDETRHTGVQINTEKLAGILGVPCVPTTAITGEGVKNLVDRIPEAGISALDYDDADRWQKIGEIVGDVQKVTHRHHTALDKLEDASVRPFSGMLIALVVLAGAFEAIRFIGEGLIGYVFEPLFETVWAPVMMRLSALLGGGGVVHDLLIGRLVEGNIDFGESFGLLTTGLFVPIGAVLPYVFAFYLALSFLEDTGYLPRLAVMMDGLMHRLGLHGLAIVPTMLGLGCNVPGALSARIMESRKERFITATLMAISVPCMAQIAMIVGLVGEGGAKALLAVFGTLFLVWLGLGMLMNRIIKGESPEILIDVPPYRIPYWKGLFKKLWMRVVWFLREAVPWVMVGVFVVNVLYTLRVIDFIGGLAAPVITGILGLPLEAVGGLVVGFLRKDVAVGMLVPLHLTVKQAVVASVVLAMYFPCVATFAVLIKEFGIRDMLKAAAIMVVSAFTVGGLLNVIL
ncbi:MAG: ferrous iron transporter B [Candidatus Eisenbacteria sp.]|nr:ferrous iron transporter B [Candidatus Eisenbacteria bacterium]